MLESIFQIYDRLSNDPDELEKEIQADIQVDEGSMGQELKKQAANYLKWGRLTVIAEKKLEEAKTNVALVWTEARERMRAWLIASGERVTEKRIDSESLADEQYVVATEEVQKAELLAKTFAKVEHAIFSKSYMLQSINARQQREFGLYPQTMEEMKENARVLNQASKVKRNSNS